MGYIDEDSDFSEEEYDKELDELQEDEKPEKGREDFGIGRKKIHWKKKIRQKN